MFDAVSIIRAKRDGEELSTAQIKWVVSAYTDGTVAEEQMSALAMAIFLRGMTTRETVDWTHAMIDTGESMDWSMLGRVTADKHSTGGVGDKVSLTLAPLVASFGVAVPMLSGRGLAHTGGTLDKLESIPGYRVELSAEEMVANLRSVGVIIAGASGNVVPADKKLYALRDVTATVESVPLTASSIMSKKIAAGADSLIIDVKVGSGAFMKNLDAARTLARTMVDLGNASGVHTSAIITDMNVPLGRAIGNALEIEETLDILSGHGPADLTEEITLFARRMLEVSGIQADPAAALKDGRAMATWRAMVRAQGGDPDAPLPRAARTQDVLAQKDGFITRMDALALGTASWRLGAGRARKEDPVQAGAGIQIRRTYGEYVHAGEPILTLHTDTPERFDAAIDAIASGLEIGPEAPAPRTLIYEEVK
ncbi:thymidine phosphorylase [Neoactinobaculum massilliense]|uniref:thymidine phosphorylase n=1 Tax=Neoactinobaculum massilliense TaxID=2364794 RepID=UPI000F54565E|nr:thymidine phosphorylase [Neoactinobaculum massilliense]